MPDCSLLCSNIMLNKIRIQLDVGEKPMRHPTLPEEVEKLIRGHQIDYFVKLSSVILSAILFALIVVKVILNRQIVVI